MPTDPKPVDAALEAVQTAASAVAGAAASATPADMQAVDRAAQTAQEIATEIEAASPPVAPATQENAVASERNAELHRLLAIEVPVIVQLGGRRMTVAEVMRFAVGAIIEISKGAEDELELLANNKGIGKGHAVKVGENFGIKITSVGSVKETILKLGGR